MENPKKPLIEKKQDSVQEPVTDFGVENDLIESNSENFHPILKELISKSIQDSIDGKGISNDEMMRKVKLRYPFLK